MKLLYFSFFFLFLTSSQEQQVYGYLSGSVHDHESNQPLSFAKLSIVNQEGEKLRTGQTTRKGEFIIQGVPKGKYSLEISSPGYRDSTIKSVIIPQKEKLAISLIPLIIERDSTPELIESETIILYTEP